EKVQPKEEPAPKVEEVKKETPEPKKEAEESKVIEAKAETLKGLKVVGRIDLPEKKVKKEDGPVASSDDAKDKKKKKRPRKRIRREQAGSPRSQADENRDASKRKPGFSSRARVKKE